MSETNPRIYVACLAAYNSGRLHGRWIDADQGVDHIWDEINEMLASSPIIGTEEWAIHDYDNFGSINLREWEDIEDVAAMATFIGKHGSVGAELLAHVHDNIEEAERLLEECYQGEFESEEDFVHSLHEDMGDIPENLEYYIDYEKMARDYFISDYFSIEVGNKVHVFINA